MSAFLSVIVTLFATSSFLEGTFSTPKFADSQTISGSSNQHLTCSSTRPWWTKKGLEQGAVPETPFAEDSHLSVCQGLSQQGTCCSVVMEDKLDAMASKNLNSVWRNALRKMEREWKYYLNNFQRMFHSEISHSETDLHDMYFRTYGDLYINNSIIFTHFFRQLTAHLEPSRFSRLSTSHNHDQPHDTVDRFFKELMWKMLTLFPDQKIPISNTYYNKFEMCSKRHMNDVRTFEDIPQKVRNDIQKSFSTAQKFLHAMSQGKHVLNALYKIKLDEQCKVDVTRMLYCQHCSPSTIPPPPNHPPPPCQSTCVSVLSSCLQHLQQVNNKWNNYIKSLSSTYTRLKSPILNLASSLGPLSVKISEAIMHFQENKDNIMIELEKMCGGRLVRRSAWLDDRTIHRRGVRDTRTHTGTLMKTDSKRQGEAQGKRQNRGVKWLDDNASVAGHFEKQALTSTDLILNIPTHFCSSALNKRNLPDPADPDAPDCWNATLQTRREVVIDKQRDKEVDAVVQRLSYFEELQDRRHGKKKKKKTKVTASTTTTTTTTKEPDDDAYNGEEDDYSSGSDDDYYSGDDGDDEVHGEGGLVGPGLHATQDSTFKNFPNFDSNAKTFDRFSQLNQQSHFNIANNNNNNNFNKQPHYSHNHYSHNSDGGFKVQQTPFNNNINNINNNNLNSFNKDIMDESKFYKQYMNIITKPPFIRPYSSAPSLHPSLSLPLLLAVLKCASVF